jgi:hypothetical protein
MWKFVLETLRSLALGLAGIVQGMTRKLPRNRNDKAAPIQIEMQKDELGDDGEAADSQERDCGTPTPS